MRQKRNFIQLAGEMNISLNALLRHTLALIPSQGCLLIVSSFEVIPWIKSQSCSVNNEQSKIRFYWKHMFKGQLYSLSQLIDWTISDEGSQEITFKPGELLFMKLGLQGKLKVHAPTLLVIWFIMKAWENNIQWKLLTKGPSCLPIISRKENRLCILFIKTFSYM